MPGGQLFHNLLDVAQLLILFFEFFLHAFLELGIFQFLQQKTIVIVFFICISLEIFQLLKLFGRCPQLFKLLRIFRKILRVIGQCIQHFHLKIVVGELHGLMLRVHIHQLVAQGTHYIQSNRGIVYKCPRFTARQNFPPQNSSVLVIQFVFFKKRPELIFGNIELGLYHTFLCCVF